MPREDHEDALLEMARALGGAPEATAARCVDADRTGLDLIATTVVGEVPLRVVYEEPIANPRGLRNATVKLAQRARAELGLESNQARPGSEPLMADSQPPLTGGCMCAAVRFQVSEPLLGALYCHCKRCQRRTGTAFSTTALTAPGSFRVSEGEELVRTWDPGDGGYLKSFCSACGSQLFTTNPDSPELVAIRVGALDGDPGIRPSAHQFVNYAPDWAPVTDDGLPRFPERIDRGAAPPPRS